MRKKDFLKFIIERIIVIINRNYFIWKNYKVIDTKFFMANQKLRNNSTKNIKRKFRKINKKLMSKSNKLNYGESPYNLFYNKKGFIIDFFLKINKGDISSEKKIKEITDALDFIRELPETIEEFISPEHDLNEESENLRQFGFKH